MENIETAIWKIEELNDIISTLTEENDELKKKIEDYEDIINDIDNNTDDLTNLIDRAKKIN